MKRRFLLGISALTLTRFEIELFRQHPPYGIILFKRNCQDKLQLQTLTREIKSLIPKVKIFIDQEGGRVARLRQPEFTEFPPANSFSSTSTIYDNYLKMGQYLYSFGIDANCAPVADLYYSFADNIIGDRSFGSEVSQVVDNARACANGLLDSGILPVVKHIPGHGRALVDSHLELPVIDTDLAILEREDFAVFKQLNDLPLAMTAHVVYTCLDPNLPVSLSKIAISYIRQQLGFKGLLISDDINMKALQGDLAELANQAFAAGCDVVCHCSGDIDEMRKILVE